MNARRLRWLDLWVVVFVGLPGCQPVVQHRAESRETPAGEVRTKTESQPVWSNRDDTFLPARLLAARAVQQDLELSADQMGKIRELTRFSQQQMRELAAIWHEMVPDRGSPTSEARTRELGARGMRVAKEYKRLQAQIVEMLTPSQRERLRQIQLQYTIAVALIQPSLAKGLDISDEQLDRIREHARALCLTDPDVVTGLDIPEEELKRIRPSAELLVEQGSAELRVFDGLNPDETLREMMKRTKDRDETQSEANKLALEVLTPQQRSELAEFVGKEIEVSWDYDALMGDH